MLDRLEGPDGHTELLAPPGMGDGVGQRPFRGAQQIRGEDRERGRLDTGQVLDAERGTRRQADRGLRGVGGGTAQGPGEIGAADRLAEDDGPHPAVAVQDESRVGTLGVEGDTLLGPEGETGQVRTQHGCEPQPAPADPLHRLSRPGRRQQGRSPHSRPGERHRCQSGGQLLDDQGRLHDARPSPAELRGDVQAHEPGIGQHRPGAALQPRGHLRGDLSQHALLLGETYVHPVPFTSAAGVAARTSRPERHGWKAPLPIWSRTVTTAGFVRLRRCQFAPSTTRVWPEMNLA